MRSGVLICHLFRMAIVCLIIIILCCSFRNALSSQTDVTSDSTFVGPGITALLQLPTHTDAVCGRAECNQSQRRQAFLFRCRANHNSMRTRLHQRSMHRTEWRAVLQVCRCMTSRAQQISQLRSRRTPLCPVQPSPARRRRLPPRHLPLSCSLSDHVWMRVILWANG